MTVAITHPDLPGRVSHVPERSLPAWQRVGWLPASEQVEAETEIAVAETDDPVPEGDDPTPIEEDYLP